MTTGSGPDRVAPASDASSSGADIARIVRTEVESERWFHDLIDSLPAAIYTTDAGGRLTHFNQAAVAFSGRVPELGTDRWCISWKLYHPDGRPMPHDECPMAIALKENRIVRGADIIVERPDGTRIWCAPYPTPLRDATGRVIGGVNMLIDLTDRKQAEEANNRLAAIVESSDDAIISKDLNGVITSWNRGAEHLFGYAAAEAIGRPVTILFPPDRLHEEPRILEQIRRGQAIEHYETIRRRKDGTLVDISLTVSPVRDDLGRIVGVSKIARDITQRKRAEQILRDHEAAHRRDLEHALQSERRFTEIIQRSLLPDRVPQLGGVEFAARYMPASPDAAVGGDFYDVFELPDGRLGLAIGDVAGQGVQAASVMGQVRMVLRAYAYEGHPPATVLDRLNRLLRPGEMVTLLYAVLDPISGQMTYANAGHPPPFVLPLSGSSAYRPGVDPPLVGGWYDYRSHETAVAVGDAVILYTDGLVESAQKIGGGLARLAAVSTEVAGSPLEGMVDAVVQRLVGEAARRDDVAVLAFRLQPLDPAHLRIALPTIPSSLRTLRLSLRRWLEVGRVREPALSDIMVACGEAGANAIQHAYGPNGGSFELEAKRETDRIVIWIRDSGAWRFPRNGDGGRGLMIMERVMDSVNVIKSPGGTTVYLERRLHPPANG